VGVRWASCRWVGGGRWLVVGEGVVGEGVVGEGVIDGQVVAGEWERSGLRPQ
jgi:hypothetical protein